MIEEHKREIFIGIAVLIAVILVIIFFFVFKKNKVEAPMKQPVASIITPKPKKPAKIIHRRKKIVALSELDKLNKISYTEAFMKYRNGHIIQFSKNCQSSPYYLVVPKGSNLMLDNRSDSREVISIGDNKYDLDPYGFEIIHLSTPKVPTKHLISCTVSRNVNTLIIE